MIGAKGGDGGGGGGGATATTSGATSTSASGLPASRLMKVRFFRTSTWMVRGATRGVGGLDLGLLGASERDLLAWFRVATVDTMQVLEQLALVLLAQAVGEIRLGETGGAKLLQQPRGLNLQFGGELRNRSSGP